MFFGRVRARVTGSTGARVASSTGRARASIFLFNLSCLETETNCDINISYLTFNLKCLRQNVII